MRLTTRNLHHYLLDKGFITIRSLVDGDYQVVQGQSRNLYFRIIRSKAKSLFVKQLTSFDQNNTYVLQKDATCLWLIKNNPAYEALSDYVPDYFGFDPERQVLVTEYLPDARNLEDFLRHSGSLSDTILTELAHLLASFHFPADEALLSNASVQFFPKQLPWIFNIADNRSEPSQPSTPSGNPAMLAVTGNAMFSKALLAAKSRWKASSLIHGDIKWMNLLLHEEAGRQHLKIIDWEIADIGDPLWDVAGVFQNILTDHLLHGPGRQEGGFDMVPGIGLADLQPAWPAVLTFWDAYCARTGKDLESRDRNPDLEDSLAYTGVRLIQTATEYNMMNTAIQPSTIKLLQASYTILTNLPEVLKHLQTTFKAEPA